MAKNDEMMAALLAKVAELEKQLAAKKSGERAISYKVSDKGALSVYGLGRFPNTMYVEQWERLLDDQANMKAFIEKNRNQFRAKGEELTPEQQALIDAKQKAYASKITTMAKAS